MDRFSASLGLRLRAARRQRGWSLGELESYTGGEFKASVVGAYERGERALSVQRLVRLAEIYAVPPSELLPLGSQERGVLIDLDVAADAKDGDLIDRYLAAIHFLRREGRPDEVRDSDKAVIASLLDSTVEVASGPD
ncbi:MAG TPA: helix-turn-helix transcriptional regulator [Acidimicrobiia bacterium]|nr:Helix-turn-helix domain [Acidimicrobiia bacterium]HYJ25481.1 helix-turn-helix transcriptional regulator [Acidimicrobiia bacterium]